MSLKISLIVCVLAAVVHTAASQGSQQQVVFFDDKDFSGGSQTFPTTVPATGCSKCTELNFIRTNSWESYISSGGSSIILYDSHGCGGKTSGKIPAAKGVIPGTLADSVDSFELCA